jgi:hypothetical protein
VRDGHDQHDVRLVDSSDPVATCLGRIVESVTSYALGRLHGDELDGLNNAVDDLRYHGK